MKNNVTLHPHPYNSKEKQEDFELGWLDDGARMYSPDVPRWWVVDPLAEKYANFTPYSMVLIWGSSINLKISRFYYLKKAFIFLLATKIIINNPKI